MGHSMPNVAVGRGGCAVGKWGFLPQKPRSKWKKNDGRRKQGLFSAQEKPYEPTRFQNVSKTKNCFVNPYEPSRFQNVSKTKNWKQYRPPPPEAPRNTTSYIIRSKHLGGIAPLVTPSPITPAILPTPSLSPAPRYKEQFADEVSEWGVDGYGSMNGLIRVRADMKEDSESESDGDRHPHAQSLQQLEQRLDQDLSRFEIVYPSVASAGKEPLLLEVRMVDQDYHIAQLEEENNTLKERLYSIERELDDLRNRMQMLEGIDTHCEQGEVCSEKSVCNE